MRRRSIQCSIATIAALATLGAAGACREGDASAEWQVARAHGPLALAISYPTEPVHEGHAVTILGTTGNASAQVTLDGAPVFVASNGAFAGVAPSAVPGMSHHRLIVRLGGHVAERAIPIVSAPNMPSVGGETARPVARHARITRPVVGDVHLRGGPYERVYLYPDAIVRLDSSRSDSVHAVIEPDVTLWLAATAVSEPTRPFMATSVSSHGRIVLTRAPSEPNAVEVRITPSVQREIVILRERAGGYTMRAPGMHQGGQMRAEATLAPGVRVSTNGAGDVVDIDVDDAAGMIGYELTREGRDMVFRLRQMPAARRALRVIIDPGHPPLGATGPTGVNEAVVTLAIARHLQRALQDAGATAVLSRETMVPVPLSRRVALVASTQADVVVSLHADASPDGVDPRQHAGPRTFFLHSAAAPLASAVQRALVRRSDLPDRGVVRRSLAITDIGAAASILCEIATLTDPEQEALLADGAFQAAAAKAIAQGVLAYADQLGSRRSSSIP